MTVRVVAEFGQSHQGDLARAMAQADLAQETGCWAAKWQTFRPENIASAAAGRYWDEQLGGSVTQLETFKSNGMLAWNQWQELADYCRQIGIIFLSTPFDLEAVTILEDCQVPAYKIASGDITYRQLLERVAETGKPILLSTGAAHFVEVQRALRWLSGCNVTLLACTLSYPCPDSHAHLGRIEFLRRRFGTMHDVGYSDHTLGVKVAVTAAAMGAVVLEKHCTLDTDGPVPDDRMALDPAGLRSYVALAREGLLLRGQSAQLWPTSAEDAARTGARRSGYAAGDIVAGEKVTADQVAWLRPYHPAGFEPWQAEKVIGRRAEKDVVAGQLIGSDTF